MPPRLLPSGLLPRRFLLSGLLRSHLMFPAAFAAALLFAAPALADACLGPIARAPSLGLLLNAFLGPLPGLAAPDGTPIRRAALSSGEVKITYIGHATFTITSPGGVVAATDYNDYVHPHAPPDIATMNHAHSTHFTHRPNPAIKHVLRGWAHQGKPPAFDVQERDMRVRNVPTNIRDGGMTEFSGNSIFIFEAAGLCVAHLGHLHHTLTPEHLKAIGQVDIVFAAVDGSWTLDHAGIIEVIGQLQPKIVIPMHYFSESVLERFLSRLSGKADVERVPSDSLVVSRANLPKQMAIKVLIGR